MIITPLEAWIKNKIGCENLSSEVIAAYQLNQLQKTIHWLTDKSIFYRQRLARWRDKPLRSLDDISQLPLTTPKDIQENPEHFLCVSPKDIARVVTMESSGTTGKKKRLYFTAGDQQLTIDFFHYGMSTLVAPGDRVLIMLPGERAGSVGDLLHQALKRLGVVSIKHGLLQHPSTTYQTMCKERITSLVGIPTQVLALAQYCAQVGTSKLKSVLLSTDYVPGVLRQQVERIWRCKVFNHYGMTEMGLGGGVECTALSGYHLREADLYFEIIDPVTGHPTAMGEPGQVVFSTLTRVGMPLIRYATGDIARFISERCACGSILRRMDTVQGRMGNIVTLADDLKLALWELDERLFAMPGVVNFTASVTGTGTNDSLNITLQLTHNTHIAQQDVYNTLLRIPSVNKAVQQGALQVGPVALDGEIISSTKRVLQDLRVGRQANDKNK